MREQFKQSPETAVAQRGDLIINRGLVEMVSLDSSGERIPVVTPLKLITFGRKKKGHGMGNRGGTIWRVLDKALTPANPSSPIHLAEDQAQKIGNFQPHFPGSLRWVYAEQFGHVVEIVEENQSVLESGMHGLKEGDLRLLEEFRDELYMAQESEN